MQWICGECGDQRDHRDASYCESCRDSYHDKECRSCDRVGSEDYGYCPDCDREDCSYCERLEDYHRLKLYVDYLTLQLTVAEIDFKNFSDFLEEDEPQEEASQDRPTLKDIRRIEIPGEDPEVAEIERRLDEAFARQKTKPTD